jgi:phosphoribosylformylglycinamidine synthase
MTDNGAGGLSSSVGEMATATGGARLDLARAPLKYPGLQPWEVLISEAQERMTLAVPPDRLARLLALARDYEVEATVLGEFTDNGRFEVRWGDTMVADLPLLFLHDGAPLPTLQAELAPTQLETEPAEGDLGETLLALLATPEHASASRVVRHYDHEVKGLSVVKPLVGVRRDVPSTATVMRARHHRHEGVVLGEGIHPFYADLDAHAMAHACVDEAVRRVLCAGARIDRLAALDNFCWPDPVQSDRTPDGQHKLAQLVRCCEGLYEACVAHGMPLVSGKDSMKNDAWIGGVKISIPPTLLVSAMGQLDDVERALDLSPPQDSDLWLLGETHDELGGSSVLRLHGVHRAGDVPRTDAARNAARYADFAGARDAGLVLSAHAIGRGGLAIALAQLAIASELAIGVDVSRVAPRLSPFRALFSETTGRIVFAARPADRQAIAERLGDRTALRIGEAVNASPGLRLVHGQQPLAMLSLAELRKSFTAFDASM